LSQLSYLIFLFFQQGLFFKLLNEPRGHPSQLRPFLQQFWRRFILQEWQLWYHWVNLRFSWHFRSSIWWLRWPMKRWVAWKEWLFFHQCSWVCLRLCRIWLWFRRRQLRESCVRWAWLLLLRWRFRWTFSSQLQSRRCVQLLFKRFLFQFNQWFHRSPCWLILNQVWLIQEFRCFLWWHFLKIQWWLISQKFIRGNWLIIRHK
jgi:hypothetical protein